jgi:hypothetical protein
MAKADNRSKALDHMRNSPHLFSARANRDYETMATHANEVLGGNLTAKDAEAMMTAEAAPTEAPKAAKKGAKRAR